MIQEFSVSTYLRVLGLRVEATGGLGGVALEAKGFEGGLGGLAGRLIGFRGADELLALLRMVLAFEERPPFDGILIS